ncbi:MAG: STAS domain-containing protein [Anaerolineae bacterium]
MNLITSQHKRCDLIKVSGRLDNTSAPRLGDALNTIIAAGRFNIVLDMSGVEYISSAGLRVLIDAQKVCKRWNRGEVVLANVPQPVREVLDMVGFTPLFRFFDDSTAAVGSF